MQWHDCSSKIVTRVICILSIDNSWSVLQYNSWQKTPLCLHLNVWKETVCQKIEETLIVFDPSKNNWRQGTYNKDWGRRRKKTTEETFHHLFDRSGNAGYGFANCNEIQDVSGVTVSMGLIYEKDLGHKETIVG